MIKSITLIDGFAGSIHNAVFEPVRQVAGAEYGYITIPDLDIDPVPSILFGDGGILTVDNWDDGLDVTDADACRERGWMDPATGEIAFWIGEDVPGVLGLGLRRF